MRWVFFAFAMVMAFHMLRWIFGEGDRTRKRLRDKHGRMVDGSLEAALEQRDQVIEDLQHRISELESRLDFTERMLAGRSETARS